MPIRKSKQKISTLNEKIDNFNNFKNERLIVVFCILVILLSATLYSGYAAEMDQIESYTVSHRTLSNQYYILGIND